MFSKERGKLTPLLEGRPMLYEDLIPFWEAFKELTWSRAVGFSVGPIPIQAIKDYVEIHEWSPMMARELVVYTRALDKTYLEYVHKKEGVDSSKEREQIGSDKQSIRDRSRDVQSSVGRKGS